MFNRVFTVSEALKGHFNTITGSLNKPEDFSQDILAAPGVQSEEQRTFCMIRCLKLLLRACYVSHLEGCGGGSTFYELYFSRDYPVCSEQMSKTEPQKSSKRLRAGKCGPVWSIVGRQVAGRGTLSKHKSTTKAAPPAGSRGLC